MRSWLAGRDRLAVLAGVVAPLVVAVVLVPFRGGFAGTDAALVLIVVVVAVGASGYRPAGAVAAVSAAALTDQVCGQLTALLDLQECRFQAGVAGIGNPARLGHDGLVVSGRLVRDVERDGLPAGREVELLAEAGGLLQGRFLLIPADGSRPSLEQRLVAAALADQAGAALSAGRLTGHRT